jgi:hypothetical protein
VNKLQARIWELDDKRDLIEFAKAVMRSYRGGTSNAVLTAFERLPDHLQCRIGLDGTDPEKTPVQP